MEGNCPVNDVVDKCDVARPLPKKVNLELAERERENGKTVSITTSYHLNTRHILIRQHFQAACGT